MRGSSSPTVTVADEPKTTPLNTFRCHVFRKTTTRNIVSTVNLDCKLELKNIALSARNAEYNPKISHEAPVTRGFGAEISASIVECCFLRSESPVARVCSLDTPFPLVFEPFYMPTKNKILDAIKSTINY